MSDDEIKRKMLKYIQKAIIDLCKDNSLLFIAGPITIRKIEETNEFAVGFGVRFTEKEWA